ncbi:MAG: LysR family transcriptional regulator, partial [Deltaproteobacteria bacterium]
MNLKHLETFYHFCRFMTMSRAAEHLHVSQPAVSQQLSLFQAECGVKLFYREASEYRLTDTGEALFLLSKRIFSRVGQIEDLLEDARKSHTQTLRIGTTKTFARTLMPDLVATFQEKYPAVQLRLTEANSAGLIQRVAARQEDVVIVARSKYDSSLKAIPFAHCEFVLVARPDHPLTSKGPISIQSLSGESLIIRERGSGSRNAILGTLRRCGVSPAVFMESD